jgi:hypothetical protein
MVASLSQSLGSFVIPGPESHDPESVQASLALARREFERGDLREALRHLRQAAEGADDAGSELRAVALARAAADLATEVSASVTPPPVSVAPSAMPPSVVRATTESALKLLLDSGRAVKVVVKRSARDEGLYIVRREESHVPALGTREAVMVLLEPDDAFFADATDAPD